MFAFARTSKRMQEMVYDDTRWVQRLKSMGCWNDVEAKQRFEEAMRRKTEAQRLEEAQRTGVAQQGGGAGLGIGGIEQPRGSMTLFDADEDIQRQSSGTR